MIDMQFHYISHSKHEAAITIPDHTHQYHELVYFVYGDGSTAIRGERSLYHGNYFAFYRAGTVHDEVNPVPCETLATTFLYGSPHISLEEGVFHDEKRELLPLVRKLRRLSLTVSPYRDVLLEACLANILVTAEQIQKEKNESMGELRPDIDWSAVIDIIDDRYREEVDFHEIAADFHYSYSRFRHLFTAHFSVSPREYLIMRRLEQARTLLRQTELSITEIAYRTGFATSSNFTKAFRTHYGMPPKEYRKTNR